MTEDFARANPWLIAKLTAVLILWAIVLWGLKERPESFDSSREDEDYIQ